MEGIHLLCQQVILATFKTFLLFHIYYFITLTLQYLFPYVAASSSNRRGRGPTRDVRVLWDTAEGRGSFTVEWPAGVTCPLGPGASHWASELRRLIEEFIPVTTPKWSAVSLEEKDNVLRRMTVSTLTFVNYNCHLYTTDL